MKRISIAAIAVALLAGAAPAWTQTQAPTQAQSDLRQARDQAARDRQALEGARKSGDAAKIKAAEDKLRASERTANQRRAAVDKERVQADQARTKASAEDLKKSQAQQQHDRQALEAARKSGDPAKVKAAEDKLRASERGEKSRDGKGKSGWAHDEKKGQGKNKER